MSAAVIPSGYAIRFLPRDPRDVSPALYLSTDDAGGGGARLTSVSGDVEEWYGARAATLALDRLNVRARCEREYLVADVVTLDVALRDLEAT